MKTLEVRKQVHMRFRWLIDICLNSMVHRLLRSMVTVVIITLAIAFLTFIMVDSYIGASVRDAVQLKVDRITLGTGFLREASRELSNYEIINRVSALQEEDAFYANIRGWGGFDDQGMRRFHDKCMTAKRYLDFFTEIPAGRRVLLIENNVRLNIFNWLLEPENLQLFEERLGNMPSVRIPGEVQGLEDFIGIWPTLRDEVQQVRLGYRATVNEIRKSLQGRSLAAALGGVRDEAEIGAFFAKLAAAGFQVHPEKQQFIAAGIRFQGSFNKAIALLRSNEIRTGWFRRFQQSFSPVDALRRCAVSDEHLDWVYETLGAEQASGMMSKDLFRETARTYVYQQNILASRLQLIQQYGETGTLNERAVWLIIVSFLVCVVGIANAMLMTVLERFKEIATMKCLGARKETIGIMFMLESLLIGVVGGILGIILGFIIDIVRQLFFYRALVFEQFPFASVALSFVIAFACSLLLALIAAIYPAILASKMAPMEAMRVD